MEIVSSIVSKVFELLVEPTLRQIKYVFNYSDNIHNLEEEVRQLTLKKQIVEHTVEEAVRRNPVEVEDVVPMWFTKVNNVTEDASKILLRHEDKSKRRCFMGLCPNLIRRHQISRKASKALPIVVRTREEGNFEKVCYRITPQGIGAVKGFEAFESRTSAVEQIMNALKDADVNLIGVYGMGGVGKTTLVKQIAAQVREYGIFKLVVMATVTHNPELKKVQQDIADWLDYKFDVESVEVRAARLSARIKKEEKILIILDDIWAAIKLEEVGIPYGRDHKGSKILMTSRNQSVLLEMGVQRAVSLEVLQQREAWNLFEKIVGDLKDSNLGTIPSEVAGRCAGLPILIVAVATGLKNKQICEWNDALEGLKKFDGKEERERVYSALELSYNFLRDEERSLFQLLGQLAPHVVLISDLLKYSMGLGLFNQRTTLKATRDRLLTVISYLKMSCLLLEGDNHEQVKMHDVVYSFAASSASKHHHVFTAAYQTELEEWPNKDFFEQCTSISLPYCNIPKLPEVLECPKLKSFFMFNNSSLKIPGNLFSRMEELKVLDLTGMHLSPLPLSLQYLKHLQTLCLDRCVLEDISAIGDLKQLQVLSFIQSTIVRLPSEVRKLTRLRLLDLSRCRELEVISPDVLSGFAQLEELYMGDGFVQWKGEGHDEPRNNANLSELKLLSKLYTLEVHIVDANIIPKDLFSEKLERFRVFIGDVWDWSGKYKTSRTLKLKLSTSALLERVKVLLMKTEDLYLDDLKGVRSVLYELDDQGFPELKHLHVQNSHGIQYIIDWMIRGHSTAFPRLESLFIDNLNNLKKIYCGSYMVGSFSNLRKLKVGNCNALRSLFSFSMFKGLEKLEKVDVSSCEIMEEIVVEEGEDDEKINLPQLRYLRLENLPQFVSFCSRVKEATTSGGNKEIECEDETETPMPLFSRKVSFPNLTILIVDGCDNLKNLLSLSSVVHLKRLEICNCKMMEEVMVKEGLEEEIMSKMLLHQLESLELMDLPKLTRFCTSNLVECPVLKELRIQNCPQMRTFVSNYTTSNMASSSELDIINSALFDEKVAFPNLEQLEILNMDNLKMIWHSELHSDSFCKINALTVEHCEELIKIFPSTLLRGLRNLQRLVIHNCDLLQEVFDLQELIKMKESVAIQLRTQHIEGLPNLKHVWNEDPLGLVLFDNLSSVYVWRCPNLKFIFPASIAKNLLQLNTLDIGSSGVEEIVQNLNWVETNMENQPMVSFPNLTILIVDGCDNLKNLLSLSSVVHLKRLEICNCKMMEEVMVKEGLGEEIMSKMLLHQLEYLKLENLPKLTRFCASNLVECPVLKELRIKNCPQMRTFVSNYTTSNMASSSELDIINSALFDEKVAFPNMEQLEILNMDNLKMIWHSELHSDSFCKINALTVEHCEELIQIFPSTLLRGLRNLQRLVIHNCDLLQEVFDLQELIKMKESVAIQLRTLRIEGLPNLKHVWNEDPLGLVLFDNLISVRVWNCPDLKIIFPASIAKNLLQLKRLHIGRSGVEEIVQNLNWVETNMENQSMVKVLQPHFSFRKV
ncbi:hypothetical protein GH714_024515 [Hevea brasiliensis]|uniref:AAA+ ATPase domain-containing protein n=1 Tax=Hevea brasiliensis TaxID=3981 RepID=A0A6A6L363_HEVBR|nr:hypothetical protein GH714_024515 [Hevea brasiliensis]